ncbi:flagellar hook-associated protein FlgK [Actinotalea sp.]|uniref:flagellar hook-associated protein FlgK n=1 Tax=Actinotalea sp. TaxID=1872145 RepID=UPI0035621321
MSTFSGISTALSSLIAQRQALDVAGQNIANSNTVGYTRQRAETTSVPSTTVPSMFSTGTAAGNGTRVTGITRMGDVFLDARVRTATSSASYQTSRANTLAQVETSFTEPTDLGMASSLQQFWSGWQDVGNAPDSASARAVLLGQAAALTTTIGDGYRAVETQWSQLRATTATAVTQLNTTAASIADLNGQIRAISVSGGNANELIDQRDVLITSLSGLAGATTQAREDGTVDVLVAGNPLVTGSRAETVSILGATTMAGGIGQPPAGAADPVRLQWDRSGTPLVLEGGSVAAQVTDLGTSGPLASTATMWNDVATSLATAVNTLHQGGQGTGTPASTGLDFFSFASGLPAATGLSVAITNPSDVAAADPVKGALDGSWADRIAQLATATGGPDSLYRAFVVDLGVRTDTASQRATVLESTRSTAENLQLSGASVDLDEEATNMLAYQRAYEGAARVLTVMDEMLDTLINRMAV